MPSRAEMRVRLEHVLRGIVIAMLVGMLWQSLRPQSDSGGQNVNARGVSATALATWSTTANAPRRIALQLDSTPSPIERAWLGALAGAGSSVIWSGDLAPVMIDAQPIASPTGGTRVLVAGLNGSSVVIGDEVGPIDTVRAQNTGAMIALNSTPDRLTAHVKGSVASTVVRDSVLLGRILVIGDANWESKFVVAALEEEGWKVDAFIRLAPGVDVTQGSIAPIDTSRYSAVVALDGAASLYANRITEFARSGGGVVLAPEAASLDAMDALRAGAAGRASSESRVMQAGGAVSLATLALAPITSLKSDAVPFEKRAGVTAIAARRINAGRVLQVGYQDTWRWRMNGGDGAVRDHREWWSGLVASVALAQRIPRPTVTLSTDEAPIVGLGAALGPATPAGRLATSSQSPTNWLAAAFLLFALCLAGEIASRRLRGVG
jgi:hypothetical protein